MKRLIYICIACLLFAACQKKSRNNLNLTNANVQEYVEKQHVYADSLTGYATFSTDNRFTIEPEEITEEQYKKLVTDKYTLKPFRVVKNSARYKELCHKYHSLIYKYEWLENIIGSDDYHDLYGGDITINWYQKTEQYIISIPTPLSWESFVVSKDYPDTVYMQSTSDTYGTNHIFVGQEGHDCDFHGDLWFYWYDEQLRHMIPICHYKDYRWDEEGDNFDFMWISEDELVVSAYSTGNNYEVGWAGGYKATNLPPAHTPVFYKLHLIYK